MPEPSLFIAGRPFWHHVTYHTLDTPCELEYLFSNY